MSYIFYFYFLIGAVFTFFRCLFAVSNFPVYMLYLIKYKKGACFRPSSSLRLFFMQLLAPSRLQPGSPEPPNLFSSWVWEVFRLYQL